jgi:hypothetical protein
MKIPDKVPLTIFGGRDDGKTLIVEVKGKEYHFPCYYPRHDLSRMAPEPERDWDGAIVLVRQCYRLREINGEWRYVFDRVER